jgi:uncharacterized integral membrane protein (TIGR00698 family)
VAPEYLHRLIEMADSARVRERGAKWTMFWRDLSRYDDQTPLALSGDAMTTTPQDQTPVSAPARRASAIERALFGLPVGQLPTLLPGLLLAVLVVFVSVRLADFVNSSLGFRGLLSYIMMAIVIGLVAGNTIPIPAGVAPGVSFCLKKLLRLGIIMMGIRLSVFDAARIGIWGVPIVLVCIITGLVLTTYFARLLKLPARLGTLMAVGTSICGATAIVAAAPAIEAEDQEVAYAVANITVFGIAAMLVYPYLSHALFGGNVVMAGLFQGTAIHETAQVTGAALIYDQAFGIVTKPSAADVAIVIKLVRNVFIAVVVPLMAVIYARRAAGPGAARAVSAWKLFPVFILGFVAMAAIRSLGDAGITQGGVALGLYGKAQWGGVVAWMSDWAGYALAMAMAGVGLGTRLKTLKGLGIMPFYVGLFSAAVVGVASAVAVLLMGGFVRF